MQIPERVLKALAKEHSGRFAQEMAPKIAEYAQKLASSDRRSLYSNLAGVDRSQKYQRFAEIAMHEYLKLHFQEIECPENPADFYLPTQNCYIEVVTPQPGENAELIDYNRPYDDPPRIREIPANAITLKYWDSIERKAAKLAEEIERGNLCTTASTVIAVCPLLLANFPIAAVGGIEFEFPYVVRALFPVGGPNYWFEPDTGREGAGTSLQPSVDSIRGVPRRTDLFLRNDNCHVSAAIAFIWDDGWFEPWNPIVVHNPHAINGLELGFFPNSAAEYTTKIDGNEITTSRTV